MNKGRKALNVLGIIVSVLLSIVLVVSLMVMPLLLSALSLLQPETLAEAVTQVDLGSTVIAVMEENGEQLEEQQVTLVNTLLSTNAAKNVIKTYAETVFDTLGGKEDVQGFTEETLRRFVDEHKDEIAAALRQSGGEFAEMTDQELQDSIQKTVDEQAGEILQMLPDVQQMRQELVAENPTLEVGFQLFAKVDTVKLCLIAGVILLSVIIFFCRFVDLRGMKWLAVDLLVAGVIALVTCFSFGQLKTLLLFIAEENALISDLMNVLLGSVQSGLLLRTVVMLAIAAALLTGYILLRKYKKKRAEKPAAALPAEEKPAEQTVAEEAPAEQATPKEAAAETAEPNT